MALQLILGKSGSGKSYELYHKIIEQSMAHPEKKYFVVVPEQFTMQTQKDLVTMHPNHGIWNIDVLSFLRLAYRIFEEQGGMKRTVLEDTGKSMLLRKVVIEKKDQLQEFQNNVRKNGYISEIKSLLSEFFQYNIKEEQLEHMIALSEKKGNLKRKLSDMQVIYKGFVEMLEKKYITTEEILDVFADTVASSEILEGSVLALDGFTGFTPVQYKLLHKLMKKCEDVIVTVTIDPKEEIWKQKQEFELFHLSRTTMEKLYKIAREEQVDIAREQWMEEEIPYRFRESIHLACLEANLFRYPVIPFEDFCKARGVKPASQDICLFAGRDMQSEVDYAIREISDLIRTKGYRYRDIAIVTGDMENYGRLLEKAFERVGYPCFMDYKKDIMTNAMVELIRALLDVFLKNYDYESVFRYLRCGFVDIDEETVDKMENYVLALGIKGVKRWNSLWTRSYRKDIQIDLEMLNENREMVMEGLKDIHKVFSKKENTVFAYSVALHDFLRRHKIYEKIKQYEAEFEKKNMPLLAKEYAQVYEIVLEVLDKLVQLLGDETVTLREYKDLLETGFMEAKVGLIPPGVDQILIGDMERTRLKDIKALFFLGVNEGIVPKSGGKGGILSDMEREFLSENEIELAPTLRETAYTQEFYFYLNLTKPQNKLYVTYHKVNEEGKAAIPSYLVGVIRRIFPNLVPVENRWIATDHELDTEAKEEMLGGEFGKRYLLEGLQKYGQENQAAWWKQLLAFYGSQKGWEQKLAHFIDGVGFVNEENGLTRQVAEALYGKELKNSVTRVEQYAQCAFAHFLQYGLQLKERYEFRFSGLDFGNIFHEVLRLYPERLKENGYTWKEIPEEEMFSLTESCVQAATADYGNEILTSSRRNAYLVERMTRIMKRTIWAITRQLKAGAFEPVDYELSFSYMDGLDTVKMDLEGDREMRLHGRIDRLDTYEEKDAVYIKIVDYKSGKTTFQIENLYYGLQMQLVVYLNAALELAKQKHKGKNVVPAGIFYYNMDDPFVSRMDDEASVEQEIEKELKPNGFVNNNPNILQWLDSHFGTDGKLTKSVRSMAIPVETTKDGSLSKRSSVMDTEKFKLMGEHVKEKMTSCGMEILDGNTAISPYRMKDKTACEYCSFQSICNFDPKLPGNKYRDLAKLSEDEIWEKMKQEQRKEEAGDEDGKKESGE